MIAILVAAAVAMVLSLVGTRFLIDLLVRRQVSQPILSLEERGPLHQHKAGTPTMGGIAIVGAAFAGYLAAHVRKGLVFTNTGLLVMTAILGAATVGFLDDWIKVRNARNLGLTQRTKTLGLLVVAVGFAVSLLIVTGVHTTLSFTRFDSPGWKLGAVLWGALAIFTIMATSNAVNLADGLDGLASGSAIFAFIAFVVIGFTAFRHPDIYRIDHGLDLAVIAASMLGGSAGFLWWNAAPARIFMGDVGSLAIGTALACLALTLNTTLLLIIVCGLYVAITMSVIIQRISYKYFGKRRVFKMTPLHHHFELQGWPETTIIIRFWMIAGICAAVALGLFYADFLAVGVPE